MPRYDPIPLPSVEYLHSRFTFDPETGILTWKPQPRENFQLNREWLRWNKRYANKVAGSIDNGYCVVRLKHQLFLAHRIIWKMQTGQEPPDTLDHVDGKRADNRLEQLRPATLAEQTLNKGLYKNNTSGYRGVSLNAGKWEASVQGHYLGIFDTAEEASAAYEAAATVRFGKFKRR